MIARPTEDSVIEPGKFVHGPSSLPHGLHSEPRRVTRIAGKRVHYRRLDGSESFMLRANVLMVCDTEAEALAVHKLSEERDMDIASRVADITCSRFIAHGARLDALMRGEVSA